MAMPYFLGTLSPRHPPLFPPRLSLAELAKAIRSSCASESQGLGTTAATSISHGASWTYPYAAARLRMMHPTWTATGLASSCMAREGERAQEPHRRGSSAPFFFTEPAMLISFYLLISYIRKV